MLKEKLEKKEEEIKKRKCNKTHIHACASIISTHIETHAIPRQYFKIDCKRHIDCNLRYLCVYVHLITCKYINIDLLRNG